MRINKKHRSKAKIIGIVVAVIIVLGAGYVVAAKIENLWPFTKTTETSTSSSSTDKNKTAADNSKSDADREAEIKSDAKKKEDDEAAKNTTANVTVSIVDANQYGSNVEVRANADIVETGGKCTFTFSRAGSTDVVKTTEALSSAENTVCSTLVVPTNELGVGTWNLTVAYSSTAHSGSTATTVEVK
jgi:cytoskeletal protein RodZ